MLDFARVRSAYETAKELLLAERVDGHWVGELSSSALATATAVSALAIAEGTGNGEQGTGEKRGDRGQGTGDTRELMERGVGYLVSQQNSDGGWGDTDKSHSNIATTYLVVAALHLSGNACDLAAVLSRADAYLDAQGRIPGLKKRYGVDKTFVVPILTNCALAGLVPWSEVSPLPFELACVPQSWYRFVGMPVVSYAIPALVAIGQAHFHHARPWNPITRLVRSLSIGPSLRVLRRMQPPSGGYLEATPLTSFVVMSLASIQSSPVAPRQESLSGKTATKRDKAFVSRSETATMQEVIDAGIQFLVDSARPDGSWPIDTNLATWVTTLALNALAGAGEDITQYASLDWLLSCQHKVRHPFTGADPGGFGWSDFSGAVPDADDTPGAMLVLWSHVNQYLDDPCDPITDDMPKSVTVAADSAIFAVKWLETLQNRDGGWPTFCRGWGKLPFDRSGVDLTAHSIRALFGCYGRNAAKKYESAHPGSKVAIEAGFCYIERHQRPDGSWIPLWFGNQDHPEEENPIYGTAKVLLAYRDTGRTETPAAQRGFEYLVRAQNVDGGWGGGPSIRNKGLKFGDQLIESTVEETALAVEALVGREKGEGKREKGNRSGSPASLPPHCLLPTPYSLAQARGVAWLCSAVENGMLFDPAPIGFYFAKLWYYERLYPLVFTVSALGRVLRDNK